MSPSPLALLSLLALALSPSTRAAPLPVSGPSLGERSAADGVEPAFLRRSFDLVARLDYQPAIVFPTADTVWTAGTKVNVTWDATLPKGIKQSEVGQTAYIYLGYEEVGEDGLHLDIDRPIGTKVPLYGASSSYEFTLPADLASRAGYLLTLGSTGNQSPLFTIKAGAGAVSGSSSKAHSATSVKKSASSSKKAATTKTSSKKHSTTKASAKKSTSKSKTTTTKKTTTKSKTTTATTKPKSKSTTTTKHKSAHSTIKAKASASSKKSSAKSTSSAVVKAFASSAQQINAIATSTTSPAAPLATIVAASSAASSSLASAVSSIASTSSATSASSTLTSSAPATATAVAAAAITSAATSGAKERYAVGAGAIGAVFLAVAAVMA